jgi:hypothetical protein
MPQPTRDQVFLSYSRRDTRWLEDLDKHLKPYLNGSISRSDKPLRPDSDVG